MGKMNPKQWIERKILHCDEVDVWVVVFLFLLIRYRSIAAAVAVIDVFVYFSLSQPMSIING